MRKAWIKRGLVASGATRLAASFKSKGAVVLMYHSVMDDPGRQNSTLGGITHSTTVFERQMELIARKYRPVSLIDLLQSVREENELPSRAVVVTFDDGYGDNQEVALPVLNRVGVPATFYITVDCVETGKLPWPSRLRYAFLTSRERCWKSNGGSSWPLTDAGQRERAFLECCDMCAKFAGDAQEDFVCGIEKQLRAGPPQQGQRLMMTWDQVRDLVKHGHIVGSHTLTHPNMAYIDAAAASRELSESKQKLENALQAPVVHFSYPCPALSPHWSEQTLRMTRDAGYHTAVTADGGMVRTRDNPLCLHRIRPTKEVEGLRWNLECTFLGRAM